MKEHKRYIYHRKSLIIHIILQSDNKEKLFVKYRRLIFQLNGGACGIEKIYTVTKNIDKMEFSFSQNVEVINC